LSPQGIESAIEAANNLLHSAEELAKSIRRQGREEAAGIRTEATAEARATKNDANQMAIVLLDETEVLGVEAKRFHAEMLQLARQEVAQIRSDALNDAETILNASREKASYLIEEAEERARDLIQKAESEYQASLNRTQELLAAMDDYERRATARISEMGSLLERIRQVMEVGDAMTNSPDAPDLDSHNLPFQ
jgi:vacuolar-type H+-ATPase subunit E/Vma4